jgi:hypothetical protein
MGCIFSSCRKQRDVVKAPEEVLEVKVPDVKIKKERRTNGLHIF